MTSREPARDGRTRLLVGGGAAAVAVFAVPGAVVRDRWSPRDTWLVRESHLPVGAPLVEAVAGLGGPLAVCGVVLTPSVDPASVDTRERPADPA